MEYFPISNVTFCLFLTVDDPATDRNTLVFRLNVSCTHNPNAPAGATDPEVLYINSSVKSGQLEWVPQGEQSDLPAFKRKPPASTNPNIVIAKLRPGQEIEMELHAVKNVGKAHAKWSPVGTSGVLPCCRCRMILILLSSNCFIPPPTSYYALSSGSA